MKREIYTVIKILGLEDDMEISQSEAFYFGIAVGLNLYQRKILMAYERNKPVEISGEPYFIRSSKEQLQEAIDLICR